MQGLRIKKGAVTKQQAKIMAEMARREERKKPRPYRLLLRNCQACNRSVEEKAKEELGSDVKVTDWEVEYTHRFKAPILNSSCLLPQHIHIVKLTYVQG